MGFVEIPKPNLIISLIVDVLNQLKEKAISEYSYFISRLQKGYKEDYSDILNLINLIELGQNIDNYKFIAQYLLNNGKV